jgi:hypothetical protein
MATMKKTRWFDPYTIVKGKLVPSIRDCWTCAQAGVYLIRHKQTNSIVYIGSSQTQLKSTIYRHFQRWNDSRAQRKVYPKTGYYEIRFIKCSQERALLLEKFLIHKYQPKDNTVVYEAITRKELREGEVLENEFHNSAVTLKKSDYWAAMDIEDF